jgi:hypothetical protein
MIIKTKNRQIATYSKWSFGNYLAFLPDDGRRRPGRG